MLVIKISGALIFILFLVVNSKSSSRQRRYLIFPSGTYNQLAVGIGVPIALDNYSLTIGWIFNAIYTPPDNATLYTQPYVELMKRSRGHESLRYRYYKLFEDTLDRSGTDGKSCLLRSICEAAQTPFLASEAVGKIIYTFFTPSSTNDIPSSTEDKEYVGAELMGKKEGSNCQLLYPECQMNIFDIISGIDYF